MDEPLRAVVTGASSGIGAATVRSLRAAGWQVLATARRADRLEALAEQTGCDVLAADLTDDDGVARLAAAATAAPLHALVDNAGGSFSTATVEAGDPAAWRRAFEINVMATLRVTQALLPALRASGRGDVLVMSSTAARTPYPGGAEYVAAKHAESVIAQTLRLELVGQPVRVIEIAPGMVRTEEFTLNRTGGDRAATDAVYAGVAQPLLAEDVADAATWALTRPHHVNVDLMVIRPRAQAAAHLVARDGS